MQNFKITHKDKRTKARIGILKTKSGKIETPFFMPVATKTAVKFMSSEDLKEINCKSIISNTYILHLKPGEEIIKNLGGIKKFMNFTGINATDSGGFQMYSPSIYIGSNNQGVYFKNPFNGAKLFITPEKDMQIQLDLNSDIAMCLDSMPMYDKTKQQIKDSVEKTIIWAEKCKKEHDRLQKNLPKEKRQLLFSISQGGIYKDLRKDCAKKLLKLDFDGYAIGGIALPESAYKGEILKAKKLEQNAIKIHKSIIPENKPVYVMGEGNPVWLLDAIALGVDMFDSRYPTQTARRGTILTSKGKLKIFNSKYKDDKKPLDTECNCKVCKNYSRAYIKYQLEQNEAVGKHLATYHNLYFMMQLIKHAKQSIKAGKFLQFRNKIKKLYS